MKREAPTIRNVTPWGDRVSECSEAKRCQECGKTTREGKPFCPDHVSMHSYVEELERTIAADEEQRAALADENARPFALGHLSSEIMNEVRQAGSLSIPRLARLMHLETHEAERQVYAMKGEGLLRVWTHEKLRTRDGRDGVLVVALASRGKASA